MSAHLIVGGDGLIGRGLRDRLLDSGEVVLATTRQLNQCSDTTLFLNLSQDVSPWRPPYPVDVAYLCAAVSSFERCRTEPALSFAINVTGTVALAKTLIEQGTFVIFLSSNAVYDGRLPHRKAEEPVCPTTEYGRQKAEAERQLLTLGGSIAIVRLTKVLGPDNSLLSNWKRAIARKETISPFSDLVMAPISLAFATETLFRLVRERLRGILQVSGPLDVTYEQVARYLLQKLKADPDLIQPRQAAPMQPTPFLPEVIPGHTTLDTTRLRTQLGLEPPDVWSVLDSIL